MPDSFKYRLKRLAVTKKFILFGSLLAIIGAFLPWYQDIDKFKTGDMFLGITGPLYLAGLIVLLAGIASFGIIMLKLLDKPVPKLPLKEEHFYVFNSALSLFMLVLTASVFFHNKFGINLIDKSMGIGMVLAFIGAGFVLVGAIMAVKKGEVDFESEGKLEPLIDIEAEQRSTQDLEPPVNEPRRESQPESQVVQESIDNFNDSENA